MSQAATRNCNFYKLVSGMLFTLFFDLYLFATYLFANV